MPLPPTNVVSCATVFGVGDIRFESMPVIGSAKRNDTGSFQTKDAVCAATPCSHQNPLHLFNFCTYPDLMTAVKAHEEACKDRAKAINVGSIEDLLFGMGRSATVKAGTCKGEIRGGN